MTIAYVDARDVGTPAHVLPSTSDGLASGYQRTGSTALGALATETAAGPILVGVETLPWYLPLSFEEPAADALPDAAEPLVEHLAEAYAEMSRENSVLAEQVLPAARESWPAWDDENGAPR